MTILNKYMVDFWIEGTHRHWIRYAINIYRCHELAKQAIYKEYGKTAGVNCTLMCSIMYEGD